MTPSKPEGDENKSQTLSNGGVTIGKNEKKINKRVLKRFTQL